MSKQIPLTQGQFATVSDEDYKKVSQHKWTLLKGRAKRYARKTTRYPDGRQGTLYLHRFILNSPPQLHIDHIDGDGLNCVRENLRVASPLNNRYNEPIRRNNTSGHKGVCWNKKLQKWQGYIRVNRKMHHLGFFDDIEDAARAYRDFAKQFHGEFFNDQTTRT